MTTTMIAFINGEPSRKWGVVSDEERKKAVLSQLVRWFGPEAEHCLGYKEKVWSREEFSQGCLLGVCGPGVLASMGGLSRKCIAKIRGRNILGRNRYNTFLSDIQLVLYLDISNGSNFVT